MAVTFTPTSPKLDPNFVASANNFYDALDYSSQYEPEVFSELYNAFGGGFSDYLIAGKPLKTFNSDIILWGEQGRERQVVTGATRSTDTITASADAVALLNINDVIYVSDATKSQLAKITAKPSATTITAKPYGAAWTVGTSALTFIKAYNDQLKGSSPVGSKSVDFDRYNNGSIITRTDYVMDKSTMENSIRFTVDGVDKWYSVDLNQARREHKTDMDLALLVSEKKNAGGGLAGTDYGRHDGLFAQIRNNGGNVSSGSFAAMSDIDEMVDQLNAQGGSRNNHIHGSIELTRQFDNLLSDATKPSTGGANFGSFANGVSKLDLGFKMFTRSGFNFGYQHMRTLDDAVLLGAVVASPKGFLEPVKKMPITMDGEKITMDAICAYKKGNRYMQASQYGYADNGIDSDNWAFVSEIALQVSGANAFIAFE